MYKFFLFICLFSSLFAGDHAITYDKGSRLGDNLLCYLHAKWIAYQHAIPLRYRPFKYSSLLALHKKEIRLSEDSTQRVKVGLEKGPIDLQKEEPTLYVCPYFPEDPDELKRYGYYHFSVNWKDPEFRKMALEMICPKKPLQLITPPKNRVSIAVHIREGGGYDPLSTRIDSPLKLPPMSFYLEGLRKVVSLFPGKKIHCQIFTDALNPKALVDLLQTAIPAEAQVKFAYRKSNSHKKNVLEDFFSLFHFDILIRSQSNFSMVPSLIHDYAIVYSPVKASVNEEKVVIDEVHMEVNESLYQNLLLKKTSGFF